ncbi:MAG TPA: SDR family oxidoreductase [Jatrophihabitantaceae bacterium]|nr:SDR family oxidoreductase [Jatrophihabitantaceae bacterium]
MTNPELGARFAGRVAVVTGASRGIGLGVAQRLVAEGARVCITARKAEPLAEAAASLGGPDTVITVAGGADKPEHREEAIAATVSAFGRIDVLVNNTGINPVYGPLVNVDASAARKIIDVNVFAALEWAGTALKAGLGADGAGAIVNVASIAGLRPSPGIAYYGVSKSALIGLTTQLAAELAPNVRVNAVAPAIVKTRFATALFEGHEAETAARYPLGRLGVPEDVGAAVAFLASSDASWITGQTLVLDGGVLLQPGL